MSVFFYFPIILQALLYVTEAGEACSEDWTTDTTKYRIVRFQGDPYVSVSCRNKNVTVDGLKIFKCINGELPIDLPKCVPSASSCQPLKAPAFGSKKCSPTAPDVGAFCTFECQRSHYLSGSDNRTCSQDLRWTGSLANCYPKAGFCPSLKAPIYGSMKCSSTRESGSSCTFECKSTHYLRGSSTRRCSENLQWTGTLTRCLLKTECPSPSPLHNGTVIGCPPWRKPKYNDVCNFQCNDGFQLQGPARLTCRLNGKLTDDKGYTRVPRCSSTSTTLSPGVYKSSQNPKVYPVTLISCGLHNGYCSQYCHQEPSGIRCSCRSGYKLTEDKRTCVVSRFGNKDIPSTRPVICGIGYMPSDDGRSCVDVNECLNEELNKCNHTCENTVGSYRCSCKAGFVSSDGFRCEGCRVNSYRAAYDVVCRDCPENSHTDGNEKTSISDCICNHGFTGILGRTILCKDIDECSDGNQFGCSHTCINTPGSAHCACPFGYQLKEDEKTCVDVDECSIKNGGCDGACHNTDGGFNCSCLQGYVSSPKDKYKCEDVDECAEDNGGCRYGNCVNFNGGFHCDCPDGHHLQSDGKTCIPVYCPRVLVPHHSTLRCRNNTASDKIIFRPGEMSEKEVFEMEATCRLKCDKGYDIQDSPALITCQSNGKWNASLPECRVLQCPPLAPPIHGDVYPSSCKEGSSTVKQKCVFTCDSGYRITGQEVLTCRNNLTWSKKNSTQCVPETEVSISCPDDDITVELLPTEGWVELQLNSPRTQGRTGLSVQVRPEWVSLEQATIFPSGETEVTFTVTDHNQTAECSISVIVLDKHPPIFPDCPGTIFMTSSFGGIAVYWEEPVPEDNVGIASISRSSEPNSTFSPGVHAVEYVARDFAGNVGQCIFHINVTTTGGCEDLVDPENGEANCVEWTFGKICQPTCFDNFTRPTELFACDESGTWTPVSFISPCLPECLKDETFSPELKKCVKTFS